MLIEHFQTLEPAQRFAFLALLVPSMRMDEALNLSRKIEPRLKRDFLRELPGELALHCLSFVSDWVGSFHSSGSWECRAGGGEQKERVPRIGWVIPRYDAARHMSRCTGKLSESTRE